MRRIPIVLIVVGVLAGAVWWMFHRGTASDADESSSPTAHVRVTPLRRQEIARTLEVFGVIAAAPSGESTLTVGYECVVRRVSISVGARVAAGELLLEVDPSPDAKLQFESARAARRLAGQSLKSVRERLALKLATNQDLIAAEQAEQDAMLRLKSLTARGLGGDGHIVAPAAAVVTKVDVTPGAVLAAGTPLVALAESGGLEARLALEAEAVTEVRAGEAVTLVSVNRPTIPASSSQVRSVGAALDAVSGTAEVRVPLPADTALFAGERVRAAIVVEKKMALVAPRSAVLPDQGVEVLYTIKDGKAVRHEVTAGINAGDLVEVEGAGLNANDSIVSLGNYELADGMAVQTGENGAGSAAKP